LLIIAGATSISKRFDKYKATKNNQIFKKIRLIDDLVVNIISTILPRILK
jgi:hypothetical protein